MRASVAVRRVEEPQEFNGKPVEHARVMENLAKRFAAADDYAVFTAAYMAYHGTLAIAHPAAVERINRDLDEFAQAERQRLPYYVLIVDTYA